jgi:hypothetical protein
MDHKKILAYMLSTDMLNEYRLTDICLENLFDELVKSSDEWLNSKNIIISNLSVPVSTLERSIQRRLQHIPNENEIDGFEEQIRVKELKIGLEKLVNYFKQHPNATITGVIINCAKHSYDVYVDTSDEILSIICVLRGKHIPDDIFENQK